jgi:hypothetical protein
MTAKHLSCKNLAGILLSLIVVVACNLPILGSGNIDENTPPRQDEQQPNNEPYWMISIGGEGRDYAPSILPIEGGFVVVGMSSSYGLLAYRHDTIFWIGADGHIHREVGC